MRRWIWRALLLAAVMAALTVGAAAAEVTVSGLRYDGTEVVGPVESNRASITTAKILSEVNGVAITKIGNHAFEACVQLKTIEIPESVTSIGDHAFTGCALLSGIQFPDKVDSIGTYAFAGCTALNSIALPAKMGVIENLTFLGCTGLQNVYFPSPSVTVRAQAFEGCTSLKILHYNSQAGTTPPTQEAPDDKKLEVHGAAPLPVTSKPATCREEGVQKITVHCYDAKCNKDIYAGNRVLPKTEHKPEDIVEVEKVEPTCTKPGAEAGKRCKLCGKTVEGLTVIEKKPDAHTLVSIPAIPATCTKDGLTEGERCSECGKITVEPQKDDKKGHTYTNKKVETVEAKSATCTEPGIKVSYNTCETCGEIEECATCKDLRGNPEKETEYIAHLKDTHTTEEILALGHTPGESKYVVTTPATCEKEGEETWKVVCSVCKQECGDDPTGALDHPARKVPALGHDLAGGIETITKEPTCTEEGTKDISKQACKRDGCDFEKEAQTGVKVDPLGHEWKEVDGDDAIIKEATCKEEGQKKVGKKVCTRCKAEEGGTIEPIPRKPHTWESPKADPDKESEDKAPTCGEEGVSHVITTCTVCGETKRQEIKLPATGKHNYEGSVWTTVKNPTATENGLQERPCMNPGCTHKDSQIIPATGNPSDPDNPDDPNKPTDPEKPKTYSITLVQGAGGTASVSRTTAQEGDRITVTLSPNSGYELDMIRAIGGGTDVLSLTDLGGGQHRFTMPASNVEIRVTFERTNSGSGWASAPGDSSGGSDARRTSDVMPTQNATLGAPQAWASEQRFRDVPVGHWAAGEIEWANQMGYMNGTGGRFNPNGNITNQQMWMILARLTGSNPANMAEARHWAVQGGYADGSSPTGPVKRHQLVTALYRCARLSGSMNRNTTSLAGYNDSRNVPAVARDAFSWALANGIISGSADKNLMPNGYITRAQFAVILYRYSQRV